MIFFSATAHHGGQPWLADFKDSNFAAGSRALKRVFGVEPDFTREGGSIPVILTFQVLLIGKERVDIQKLCHSSLISLLRDALFRSSKFDFYCCMNIDFAL